MDLVDLVDLADLADLVDFADLADLADLEDLVDFADLTASGRVHRSFSDPAGATARSASSAVGTRPCPPPGERQRPSARASASGRSRDSPSLPPAPMTSGGSCGVSVVPRSWARRLVGTPRT